VLGSALFVGASGAFANDITGTDPSGPGHTTVSPAMGQVELAPVPFGGYPEFPNYTVTPGGNP